MSQMKSILTLNKLALLVTTSVVVAGCNTTAEYQDPADATPTKVAAGKTERSSPQKAKGLSQAKLMRVAKRAWSNGNPSAAMRLYGMAAQKNPQNPTPLIAMADILRKTKKTDAAIQLYKRVLETSPDHLAAHTGVGYSLLSQEKPYMAAQAFETAIALAPKDATSLGGMAVSLDTAGEHAKAQDYYRLAIKAAPNNLTYQNNLALSLSLSGRTEQAIAMLEIITTHPKATAQHRQNLALVYGMAGKSAEAMRYSRMDLSEKDARNNALYFQALNSGEKGDLEEKENQLKAMKAQKEARYRSPETSRQPYSPLVAREGSDHIGTAPAIQDAPEATLPSLPQRPHFDRYVRSPASAEKLIASVEIRDELKADIAAAPVPPVIEEQLAKPASLSVTAMPEIFAEWEVAPFAAKQERLAPQSFRLQAQALFVPYDDISGYHTIAVLPSDHHYFAQLGSFRSEERAYAGWEVLKERHADLLADRTPVISKVELGSEKGTFYRIRLGAFEDRGAPEQLCQMMISRAQGCYASRVSAAALAETDIKPASAPAQDNNLIEARVSSPDPEGLTKLTSRSQDKKKRISLRKYDAAFASY
ncbi:MAG: tetratricopeptide repeat protein [Sneathiella sp.]